MIQLFSNNFLSAITSPVGLTDTVINVADGSGMNAPSANEYELTTLYNGSAFEVVKVTSRSGNALTVEREYEGTEAIACGVGDSVFSGITAGTITRLRTESMAVAVTTKGGAVVVGAALGGFRMIYPFTAIEFRASVDDPPTGSAIIIDIKVAGSSILSTLLSIDDGSKSSYGSVAPAVISAANIPDDSEVTIDVTQVGSTNTGTSLIVYAVGQQA